MPKNNQSSAPFSFPSKPASSHISASTPPRTLLSIDCIDSGYSTANDRPQIGDVVEKIQIGDSVVLSEFAKGKSGVQKVLSDSFKQRETKVLVRVRRGSNEFTEMKGNIGLGHD